MAKGQQAELMGSKDIKKTMLNNPLQRSGSGLRIACLTATLLILSAVYAKTPVEPVTPETSHSAVEEASEPVSLNASKRHLTIARLVTNLVEQRHYSRTRIDNDLAEMLLNNYVENLDSNRSFFIQSDIDAIDRYRYSLDNTLRSGDMSPVFEIYLRYRDRVLANYAYALELLEAEPDFSVEEDYIFDRSDAAWAQSEEELREIWRKRTKNDMLSLLLADPEMDWKTAADKLRTRYNRFLKRVNSFDSDDVFEGFMNAFVRTLDPHSSYMSPQQSEEYRIQMSLSYQGIGASLQLDDELVTVLNIIPGGPAAIDGKLKATDQIVGVGQGEDGEMVDVIGWMLDDVVQLIRGPANTMVRLQIRPGDATPGDQYELSLVRNKIKLEEQAAKSDVLEIQRGEDSLRLGVITIPGFYQDFDARSRGESDYNSTTRDVEKLIREFQAADEPIDGLVLDLRGNGGGHLSEATALSGLFIPNGPVVQLRDTTGRIEVLEDPVPSVVYDGPLVVLVNRFSASASEIFAAVIQDYQRGLVIGQQTFGKGTVQNLYVLDQYAARSEFDGLGQLTLTVGKYYRVTGGSTQNRGVIPDIELPSLVATDEIGENTKPHALPWDRIAPTKFRRLSTINEDLSWLSREQIRRAQADPDFQFLLEDIEIIDELRGRNTLSLNLEKRKAEQEQRRLLRLERENSRRTARGLSSVDSLDNIAEDEQVDVLLNEAAQILTDLLVTPPNDSQAVLSRTGTS
jgi:carboxyl-terminal processing protease